MSVTITWQPLTQWPAGRTRTGIHSDANFTRLTTETRTVGGGTVQQFRGARQRIPLSRTLKDLDRELSLIGAKSIVVQIDVAKDRELSRLSDLTNVSTPAVVLTFTRKNEPLVFACDFFKRWQDNLRAIAKGLESLRLLERYHITQTGEQYRGWKALPATTAPTMDTHAAAKTIAHFTTSAAGGMYTPERIYGAKEIAREAVRSAVNRTHPDNGGSSDAFTLVQRAKKVLEAHHGGVL